MSNELDILRTCSLLHDIGKPECWANGKPWSEHINYTYKIVEEILGKEYAITSMRHHAGMSYSKEYHPQTELEKTICLADHLSSGADRRETPEHGTPLPKPPLSLTHVLSNGNVTLKETDSATLSYTTKELMHQLTTLKAIFDEDSNKGYLKLFDKLSSSRFKQIPADTRSPINDVSLWDHLKLTAAFAGCIWLDGGYKGDDLDNYEFALISGDADKISRFVNQSSRLPDLNARSETITQATDKAGARITELLGPECLIFAGGGGLLAICPTKLAEKTSEEIKCIFEEVTRGLVTITVTHLKSRGGNIQKGFGELWKETQWKMRLKKSERPIIQVEGLPEDAEACDVCHIRPFAYEDPDKILPYNASPRPERLCEFCWQLRKQGRGASLDAFQDHKKLVAVIKADGDGVGKVLGGDKLKDFKKIATPSRLSMISSQIHEVCEKKLDNIVMQAHGKCLIAGGDDILAIVPGVESLETARRIARAFQQKPIQRYK